MVNKKSCFRNGFTLVELIVVISIVTLLALMTFAAIQRVRESARGITCRNNLKQLALAMQNYESANGRFPPGTIGYPGNVDWADYRTTPEGIFWKKKQQTSFIALVLRHIEAANIAEQCDPLFFNTKRPLYSDSAGDNPTWFAELDGFSELAEQPLGFSLCPSDGGLASSPYRFAGGSQPVDFNGVDGLSFTRFLGDFTTVAFQPTNYLACVGASSATQNSSLPGNVFSGIMGAGEGMRLASVRDGLSSTVLLGESIGEVTNGVRNAMQAWSVGGLARGRGKSRWDDEESDFLGNSREANVFGFGSMHSGSVNVAFADGSVHSIRDSIDRDTFFALCGCSDGQVTSWDKNGGGQQ